MLVSRSLTLTLVAFLLVAFALPVLAADEEQKAHGWDDETIAVDVVVDGGAADGTEPESLLTSREREVLQLLAEGHSTKRIALRLGVSAKTIATHREHLQQKLAVDSIAELTKYAIRHGITTVDRQPRS